MSACVSSEGSCGDFMPSSLCDSIPHHARMFAHLLHDAGTLRRLSARSGFPSAPTPGASFKRLVANLRAVSRALTGRLANQLGPQATVISADEKGAMCYYLDRQAFQVTRGPFRRSFRRYRRACYHALTAVRVGTVFVISDVTMRCLRFAGATGSPCAPCACNDKGVRPLYPYRALDL